MGRSGKEWKLEGLSLSLSLSTTIWHLYRLFLIFLPCESHTIPKVPILSKNHLDEEMR